MASFAPEFIALSAATGNTEWAELAVDTLMTILREHMKSPLRSWSVDLDMRSGSFGTKDGADLCSGWFF